MNHRLLVSLTILCTTSGLIGQVINKMALKDISVDYLEITSIDHWGKANITIDVDYGQFNRKLVRADSELMDNAGQPIEFHSMMDALNFFKTFGYELFDVFVMPSSASADAPHFILKKYAQHSEEKEINVPEGVN